MVLGSTLYVGGNFPGTHFVDHANVARARCPDGCGVGPEPAARRGRPRDRRERPSRLHRRHVPRCRPHGGKARRARQAAAGRHAGHGLSPGPGCGDRAGGARLTALRHRRIHRDLGRVAARHRGALHDDRRRHVLESADRARRHRHRHGGDVRRALLRRRELLRAQWSVAPGDRRVRSRQRRVDRVQPVPRRRGRALCPEQRGPVRDGRVRSRVGICAPPAGRVRSGHRRGGALGSGFGGRTSTPTGSRWPVRPSTSPGRSITWAASRATTSARSTPRRERRRRSRPRSTATARRTSRCSTGRSM